MKLKNETDDALVQEVDLTPMLDVIFILLIFFIVAASFVTESGVVLNKSENNRQQPEQSPIVLKVLPGGNIIIGDRPVDIRSVKPVITRLLTENPGGEVSVRLHQRAKTETIIKAIDALAAAKIMQPTVALMQSENT